MNLIIPFPFKAALLCLRVPCPPLSSCHHTQPPLINRLWGKEIQCLCEVCLLSSAFFFGGGKVNKWAQTNEATLLRGCRRPCLCLWSSVLTFQTKVVFLLHPNQSCSSKIHFVSFRRKRKQNKKAILYFYFSALVNDAGLLFCRSGLRWSEEEEGEGAVFLGFTLWERAC